jgi:hypothetical protein
MTAPFHPVLRRLAPDALMQFAGRCRFGYFLANTAALVYNFRAGYPARLKFGAIGGKGGWRFDVGG